MTVCGGIAPKEADNRELQTSVRLVFGALAARPAFCLLLPLLRRHGGGVCNRLLPTISFLSCLLFFPSLKRFVRRFRSNWGRSTFRTFRFQNVHCVALVIRVMAFFIKGGSVRGRPSLLQPAR